jgi:hypothetical protein
MRTAARSAPADPRLWEGFRTLAYFSPVIEEMLSLRVNHGSFRFLCR